MRGRLTRKSRAWLSFIVFFLRFPTPPLPYTCKLQQRLYPSGCICIARKTSQRLGWTLAVLDPPEAASTGGGMQHYSMSLTASVWCGWEQKWGVPALQISDSLLVAAALSLPHDCICIEALNSRSLCVSNQWAFPSILERLLLPFPPGRGFMHSSAVHFHTAYGFSPLCPPDSQGGIGLAQQQRPSVFA